MDATALAELLAGTMVRDDDRVDDPAAEGGMHLPALANYLRYRLEILRLTPTQLAELAGVSRSTVYRLLGDRPPEMVATEQLHRLAAALETDPRVLAELWHGITQSVDYRDDRDDLVRSFVLATSDLSYEELRAALEVARAAVSLTHRRDDRPGRAPSNPPVA
jgi:transcriptional regulator with XRE-family HTH domain